jgi:hypothetical protein
VLLAKRPNPRLQLARSRYQRGRSTSIGPIDPTLAARVLTADGLRRLSEELAGQVEQADDKAALRWIAILAASDEMLPNNLVPTIAAQCADLLTSDTPAHIRCFAAARLLQSDYRDAAIQVLQKLTDEHTRQAVPAAQALLQANILTDSRWQVFRDTAWMAQHYAAPQAIAILLEAGDVAWALPAAFHLLVTCQPGGYHQERDDRLRIVLLLQNKVELAPPAQRYEAALALALANTLPADIDREAVQRIELKERVFDARQRAYAQALRDFCNAGLQALDACVPTDEHARMAITLWSGAKISD